jgi:hypothetical protein
MKNDSFNSGRIDLTGDGIDETILLREEKIQIFQDNRLMWESPPEWKILDAALGDPNGDGRNEVVMAISKPDEHGVLRSHPFLIGYRGGIYRQVWGGSAVHFLINEVALADIDDDGIPELVVLENRDENRQAVTVWKWQGWIFSQVWSSPEGIYENISVYSGSDGKAYIQVGKKW